MIKNRDGRRMLLAAGLVLSPALWAQDPAEKEASSAEDVLGPVEASRPLEAPAEAPSAPVATAEPAVMAEPAGEPAEAQTTVGISLDLSILLGIGVSVGMPVLDNVNLRGVYHGYTYDTEIEDDGGNYDGELRLRTVAAMADWHPFNGVFRLTAGLISNGNEINLKGVANSNNEFEVGDCAYTSNPSDPLRVNGVVDFKSTAPYFGFGWGGNMNSKPGFYGLLDIGVMFSGAPKAALSASGSAVVSNNPNNVSNGCGAPGSSVNAANDPTVQRELRDAENEANEEAKDFKLWPNLAFGFGYRF